MENLEYIDGYFQGSFLPEEKERFEKRIMEEPVFADEVAFYLSVQKAAREELLEEKKIHFRQLYSQAPPQGILRSVSRIWRYSAAAVLIICVATAVYLFNRPPSQQRLADQYIAANFTTLGVTMGAKEDSLQAGLTLFNEGKYQAAALQFESIARSDSSNYTARKYAGIAFLRLKEYDKAISYFRQLENYTELHANPGSFYHAVALMKRNRPGDPAAAKALLEQVVQADLEGKEVAEKWLKEM